MCAHLLCILDFFFCPSRTLLDKAFCYSKPAVLGIFDHHSVTVTVLFGMQKTNSLSVQFSLLFVGALFWVLCSCLEGSTAGRGRLAVFNFACGSFSCLKFSAVEKDWVTPEFAQEWFFLTSLFPSASRWSFKDFCWQVLAAGCDCSKEDVGQPLFGAQQSQATAEPDVVFFSWYL